MGLSPEKGWGSQDSLHKGAPTQPHKSCCAWKHSWIKHKVEKKLGEEERMELELTGSRATSSRKTTVEMLHVNQVLCPHPACVCVPTKHVQ